MRKQKTAYEECVEEINKLNSREIMLQLELDEIQKTKCMIIVMLCGGDAKLVEENWKTKIPQKRRIKRK